jgi:hypothetical protein
MAKRVYCKRCGLSMYPNNVTQHKRGCDKIPLGDEFVAIAKAKTIREMSEMWGVSKTMVQSRLRHLGVRAKSFYSKPISDEKIAIIVQMYNDNYPLYEISLAVGISTDRLSIETKCLLESKTITKRPVIARTRTVYECCSICKIRIDYDHGAPPVNGVCCFCHTPPDIPHDVFVYRTRHLGAATIKRAGSDAKSNNGKSHEAIRWLASDDGGAVFGLVNVVSQECYLEQLELDHDPSQ